MILILVYINYINVTVHELLLKEKYIELIDIVDTIAETMNATRTRGPVEFGEHYLIAAVEHLDRLPYIYAMLFKYDTSNFIEMSARHVDEESHLLFNAMYFTDFKRMVLENDSGEMMLQVKESSYGPHEIFIYFRWTPMTFDRNDRWVIVGGASKFSVITEVPFLLSGGPYIAILFMLLVTTWQIYVVVSHDIRLKTLRSACVLREEDN